MTSEDEFMARKEKRFVKIHTDGAFANFEIWVDTETGVNYVVYLNGNAGGITPLLDADGKVVVTPVTTE